MGAEVLPLFPSPGKKCRDCGEVKPREEFPKAGGRRCRKCDNDRVMRWAKENPEKAAEAARRYKTKPKTKAKLAAYQGRRRKAKPEETLFYLARTRAQRLGLPFDLSVDDIVVPPCCPVLGIPLSIGSRVPHEASPSLDRINPSKGYVRGNVAVISIRANRIKNDATVEELERVVAWMRAIAKGR